MRPFSTCQCLLCLLCKTFGLSYFLKGCFINVCLSNDTVVSNSFMVSWWQKKMNKNKNKIIKTPKNHQTVILNIGISLKFPNCRITVKKVIFILLVASGQPVSSLILSLDHNGIKTVEAEGCDGRANCRSQGGDEPNLLLCQVPLINKAIYQMWRSRLCLCHG